MSVKRKPNAQTRAMHAKVAAASRVNLGRLTS